MLEGAPRAPIFLQKQACSHARAPFFFLDAVCLSKGVYAPIRDCRVYTLLGFDDPELSTLIFKFVDCHSALRPSRTRFKIDNYLLLSQPGIVLCTLL